LVGGFPTWGFTAAPWARRRMLPVSTPQNAIVYGSGVVRITTMIRSGISFDIAGAILIIILLPLMVSLLGLGG
jgi:sodium-dependent dicarboxylate transporter 2/3/5